MSRAASPSDLVAAARAAGIGDERVLEAISATPRAGFVPGDYVTVVSRGDRPAGPDPHASCARPHSPAVRGVAAPPRRRDEAGEQLRTAHDMLEAIGIEAFAERARRELRNAGKAVANRTVQAAPAAAWTRAALTAQEAQVARMARDGLSNPEVAARLFISARTVQYHLARCSPSWASAPAASSAASSLAAWSLARHASPVRVLRGALVRAGRGRGLARRPRCGCSRRASGTGAADGS
jgi:DNA-binding CsgD family transcriptional regulator